MIKRESKASVLFRHWVFANYKNLKTCSFEIKQTEGDSISFSALEEHQVNYSQAIKHGPKGTLTRVESGTIGAPDYIYLKEEPAFIVVKYPHLFAVIDIDKWETEKILNKRKSLTSADARRLALHVVDLK